MANTEDGRNTGRPALRWHHRGLLGAASAIAVVALSLLTALAAPLASQASESSIPFSFNFDNLLPGEPATQTVDLMIPRDGDLEGFSWLERTGILETAQFTFEVCDSPGAGCVPATAVKKPLPVAAGKMHLRVTVVISEEGDGTAIGRLTLSSHADELLSTAGFGLASTGVNAANIALWAAAALALGTVTLIWPRAVVLAARRRDDNKRNGNTDDEEGSL